MEGEQVQFLEEEITPAVLSRPITRFRAHTPGGALADAKSIKM